MCVGVSPLYLCTTCMSGPEGPEEGFRSAGAGVTESCVPPCGCWELNLDPLEEQ